MLHVLMRHLPLASMIVLLLAVPACDDAEPPPAVAEELAVDSDDDGLTDADERLLGTSPFQFDTDGDGFGDGEELIDQNFQPEIDPLRFNPRVADVPRLRLEIDSPPQVFITHTATDDQSTTLDNSVTNEQSRGFTRERSTSDSLRTESSTTLSLDASVTANVSIMDAGYSGTVTAGESNTTSTASEVTVGYSAAHSQNNSRILAESRGVSTSTGIARSGGQVEVLATLINDGHIAYTLDNVTLGLRKFDTESRRVVEMGPLEVPSARVFSGVTSLTPGERLDGIIFRGEVPLEKAEVMLMPSPAQVRTSMYELSADGRALDLQYTQILARTANVRIDYGDGGEPESYLVATHTQNGTGLPLTEALTDVLRIPIETGTTLWSGHGGTRETFQGVTAVRDIRSSSAAGGLWTVELAGPNLTDAEGRPQIINPLNNAIDLDRVLLQPGQTVSLVYIIDADRDGLGQRIERALGLDPERADTDGDGVGDAEELAAGTDPLRGLASAEAVAVEAVGRAVTLTLRAFASDQATLDGIRIDWGDDTPPQTVRPPPPNAAGFVRQVHEYLDHGSYTIRLTPIESGPNTRQITPSEYQLNLRPALREIEATVVDGMAPMTDAAPAPDGGLYVRVAPRDDNRRVTPRLLRLRPDGSIVWARDLEPYAMQPGRARPSSRLLGTDAAGRVYAAGVQTIHAFNPDGEPRWTLEQNAVDLAVDDRGYVFFRTVGAKNNRLMSLGRIDPGGEIDRTIPLRDLTIDDIELDPEGLAFTADQRQLLLPETSTRSPRRVRRFNRDLGLLGEEPLPSVQVARRTPTDGGVLFGGTQWLQTGELSWRIGQPMIWLHRPGGEIGWQFVDPPVGRLAGISGLAVSRGGDLFSLMTDIRGIDGGRDGFRVRQILRRHGPDGRPAGEVTFHDIRVDDLRARLRAEMFPEADGVRIVHQHDDRLHLRRFEREPDPVSIRPAGEGRP
jgi:hypothetical protein